MSVAKMNFALVAAGIVWCAAGGPFEDRWVYVSRNLSKAEHVQDVAEIVKTAKSVDLNGMLLACGVERWHTWSAEQKAHHLERRLRRIRSRLCGGAPLHERAVRREGREGRVLGRRRGRIRQRRLRRAAG